MKFNGNARPWVSPNTLWAREEILDAIRGPLTEFYGEVFTIHARKHGAKSDATRPSDAEIESRLRSATQKLEQDLKRGLQDPSTQAPQQFG